MLEFCYIVHSASRDSYKIGSTTSLISRLKQLRVVDAPDAKLILAIGAVAIHQKKRGKYQYRWTVGGKSGWLENSLHLIFKDKRLRSPRTDLPIEWFNLTPDDIDWLFRFRVQPAPLNAKNLKYVGETLIADEETCACEQLFRIRPKPEFAMLHTWCRQRGPYRTRPILDYPRAISPRRKENAAYSTKLQNY